MKSEIEEPATQQTNERTKALTFFWWIIFFCVVYRSKFLFYYKYKGQRGVSSSTAITTIIRPGHTHNFYASNNIINAYSNTHTHTECLVRNFARFPSAPLPLKKFIKFFLLLLLVANSHFAWCLTAHITSRSFIL
jgi:hypothetical protein